MNTQLQSKQSEGFAEQFGKFFIELQSIFPAWRQALPTTEHLNAAKRQWFRAFQESNICTSKQLAAGLRKARAEGGDFWPAPAKFVAWCKPTAEDFGLPTFEAAYREVSSKCGYVGFVEWSHPAVYHAICQVGLFDFGQMTHERALSAFKNAYKLTVEAVMRGEPLPEVPKAIERKEPEKAKPEVAHGHLSAMKKLLGAV